MLKLRTVFLILSTLNAASVFAISSDTNKEDLKTTPQSWLLQYLDEKDSPKWASDYLLSIDEKIHDFDAHIYFRRFIADKNTRLDGILKFIEYLNVSGYSFESISKDPNSLQINPIDIYKAVYFAVTYTIMDGVPSGPSLVDQTNNSST